VAKSQKIRKGWKDVPLVGKIGIGALFLYGTYKLITHKPKPKKIKCPNTLSDARKEVLEDLAANLHEKMIGAQANIFQTGLTARSILWDSVARSNIPGDSMYVKNSLCYLHNFWLKYIDEDESLHDAIKGEWTADDVYPGDTLISQEGIKRAKALLELTKAGLL